MPEQSTHEQQDLKSNSENGFRDSLKKYIAHLSLVGAIVIGGIYFHTNSSEAEDGKPCVEIKDIDVLGVELDNNILPRLCGEISQFSANEILYPGDGLGEEFIALRLYVDDKIMNFDIEKIKEENPELTLERDFDEYLFDLNTPSGLIDAISENEEVCSDSISKILNILEDNYEIENPFNKNDDNYVRTVLYEQTESYPLLMIQAECS